MIYLLLLFIIILTLYYLNCDCKINEGFDIDDTFDMENKTIITLLPVFNSRTYLGCYSTTEPNKGSNNNLIYTDEIKSGVWRGPLENGMVNEKSVIVDLSYDTNKHLMCVAMEMIADKPVYTVYRKKTSDIKSIWIPIKSNSKTIRSICHDNEGTLLGISSFDGQIYIYNGGYWTGPINYDKPMKKITFDKDQKMIGISLLDGTIYKKKTSDYKTSKWDTENYNKNSAIDIVFDLDGKFLVATKDGIQKQINPFLISDFSKNLIDVSETEFMTNEEIISYKCGIDFEKYGPAPELGEELNELLLFKKKTINMCSNKKNYLTNMNTKTLLKQNENQNLVSKIDKLITELKSKGY